MKNKMFVVPGAFIPYNDVVAEIVSDVLDPYANQHDVPELSVFRF